MTALLCGSLQTHLGTSMPSERGYIINADNPGGGPGGSSVNGSPALTLWGGSGGGAGSGSGAHTVGEPPFLVVVRRADTADLAPATGRAGNPCLGVMVGRKLPGMHQQVAALQNKRVRVVK